MDTYLAFAKQTAIYNFLTKFLGLFIAGTIANIAHAAPITGDQCTVKTRNGSIVIMVCAPNVDQMVWQMAGRSACEQQRRCNVWIWDNAEMAPNIAPFTDNGLSKQQAASAVAIWVNDSQSVIAIRKVGDRK